MNKLLILILLSLKTIYTLSNADLFLLPDDQLFQMGIDQFRLGLKN